MSVALNVTQLAWCGYLAEPSVLISSTQPFVFHSYNFFMVGEYCPFTTLSSLRVVTQVIAVRLEWSFSCPRFQTSPHGWPV